MKNKNAITVRKPLHITGEDVSGYLLIAPWAVSFLIFTIYPFILSLKTSFLDIDQLRPERAAFSGVSNYFSIFTNSDFWRAIINTLINQAVYIPLSILLGLVFAFILSEVRHFSVFYKTVYLIPYIISIVVAVSIFQSLIDLNGPLQGVLMFLGVIDSPTSFITLNWPTMPIVAVFNAWKWFGIMTIIFMAGLAGIDREILEGAFVDGAGWFKRALRIRLPLLKPQIIFLLITNVIYGLQMFNEVLILFNVNGGPNKQGLTPVLMLYLYGFSYNRMGIASAIGISLGLIIFAITLFQLRIVNRREE